MNNMNNWQTIELLQGRQVLTRDDDEDDDTGAMSVRQIWTQKNRSKFMIRP